MLIVTTDMGRGQKLEVEKFHRHFLNSDFLFNNRPIAFIFFLDNLKNVPEGSMSQNFDLGPTYFFMLCRKF